MHGTKLWKNPRAKKPKVAGAILACYPTIG
jgi:hypothetical protein